MLTEIQCADGTKKYMINGKQVSRRRYIRALNLATGKAFMTNSKSGWPRESRWMGVMPYQAKAAQEADAAAGVPTEYTKKGNAIIRDNQHQKKLMKAKGLHNRDGGWNGITA